jgi:hypothetical protein
MRRAGEKLRRSEFRAATLYSTLQPGGMCTMASIWAKIGRNVYGGSVTRCIRCIFEDWHVDTMNFVRRVPRRSFPQRRVYCRRVRGALWVARRAGAARRAIQPLASASRGGRCILRARSTSTTSNPTLSYPPAEIIVLHRDGAPPTKVKRWGLSFF